ncbi:MAG TPA: hypothetical protein VMW35_13055 [Myxococcota bacterium]|jgi:hypothetical protein|nr:hypothetical protein [Myxococcota bacterium]
MGLAGPSIKGSLIQTVVDDVRALVERKAMSRQALDARLQAADLRIVDSKLDGARWYPIDSYGRLIEVLRDTEGRSDPRQYLLQRGMRAANRLIDLGMYRQIRSQEGQPFAKVGDVMITLSQNIYNFSIWRFVSDPEDRIHRLEVSEAKAFPEVSRIVVEGFIEAITTRGFKLPAHVASARPTPDTMVFTLTPHA